MTESIEIVIPPPGRCGNISCPIYKTLDKMEKGQVVENRKLGKQEELGLTKLLFTWVFYLKSKLVD